MPTIGQDTLTMTGSTAERIEKLWNHTVDMLMPVERCRWEWVPKDLFCLGLVGTDSPKGVDNDNDGDQSNRPSHQGSGIHGQNDVERRQDEIV